MDGVNVFSLIDNSKGFDDLKLSGIVTEILNANRSKFPWIQRYNSIQSNRKKKHSEVTWLNLHKADPYEVSDKYVGGKNLI